MASPSVQANTGARLYRFLLPRPPLHVLIFSALSLIILWHLLRPGYVLTLDMVFGPNSAPKFFQEFVQGVGVNMAPIGASPIISVLFAVAFGTLDTLLPTWLLQKLLLFLLLMLPGVGMYQLVPANRKTAKYFAGLVYAINPFIYVRFLAGNFFFLWGYALVPFVLKAFIDLLETPSRKNSLRVGIWLAVMAISPPMLALVLGLFVLFLGLRMFRQALPPGVWRAIAASLGLFFLLNIAWFYSLLGGEAPLVATLRASAEGHFRAFAAIGHAGLNTPLAVAAMYGFWRDGYDYPSAHLPAWQLLWVGFVFLATSGWLAGQPLRNRAYGTALGLAAILGVVFAAGPSTPFISEWFLVLYEEVPFLSGFRDSQKFVALLPLAYGYLGGLGLAALMDALQGHQWRGWLSQLLAVVALALPVVYSYTMLFGFAGQLRNIQYPDEYHQVNSHLRERAQEDALLVLPWHGYMQVSWAGRSLSNPAPFFFQGPIVYGDNIELGQVYSDSTNPISRYVEELLAHRKELENFGALVAPLGVKHILLMKEADHQGYAFLFSQKDLRVLLETPLGVLFENLDGQDSPQPRTEPSAVDLDPQLEERRDRAVEFMKEATSAVTVFQSPYLGYLVSLLIMLAGATYLLASHFRARAKEAGHEPSAGPR